MVLQLSLKNQPAKSKLAMSLPGKKPMVARKGAAPKVKVATSAAKMNQLAMNLRNAPAKKVIARPGGPTMKLAGKTSGGLTMKLPGRPGGLPMKLPGRSGGMPMKLSGRPGGMTMKLAGKAGIKLSGKTIKTGKLTSGLKVKIAGAKAASQPAAKGGRLGGKPGGGQGGKFGPMQLMMAMMPMMAGGRGGAWDRKKSFKIDKSGGELGEFTGKIKSFVERNNYGFIECDELKEQYGGIFLHGDMKKNYREGHTVKFTCVINKDGKASAINLKSGLK